MFAFKISVISSLSLFLLSACGSSAGLPDADLHEDPLSDALAPSPTPRPMGPPSPRAPGADAGELAADVSARDGGLAAADASARDVSAADVSSRDVSAADVSSRDGGLADASARDGGPAADTGGGLPPILQPKPKEPCRTEDCPFIADEGNGIYSLKYGEMDPPASCIYMYPWKSIRVLWFQDYQGVRYLFYFDDICATGSYNPRVEYSYVKLENVNPECAFLSDESSLSGTWEKLVGKHKSVHQTGNECSQRRGRCRRYQCYDPSGKVIK